MGTMRLSPSAFTAAAIGLGLLLFPPPASALVSQPTGEMMPNPAPMSEVGIGTSRGFPDDAVTLAGLFKYRNEMLRPIEDARTTPGTFSPKCKFTGQLVLRGGGCHVGFGWYNVTPGSTTPPPANEIYELVPAQLPMCPMPIMPLMACCDDTEFCPLATMMTTQTPQHRWNSPTFTADNILTSARYKGGLIGFAMIGDGSSQCSQTKFSQAELNVKSPATAPTNGAPWVTTLVYQSTVDPNAYYLAFEDLPVTTASWKGNGGNDGDFNDFVYYVSGLNCDGGGKECPTGMPGVCAGGTSQCSNGTTITCKPNVAPGAEICDGLDNDCDGVVDQGAPCPFATQICDRGVCVQKCNDTEFPCPTAFQCDQGYCRDPACLGKTCEVEQICVGGVCKGGCEGVVCPRGQTCRIGRCVDPCAGVDCPGGVCENGACVPVCTCRPCTGGLACVTTSGRCVDPGCEKMDCGADKVCVAGACMDPCYGTTRCPAGQACSMGKCSDLPPMGTGGSSVIGTRFDAGGGAGGISGGGGPGPVGVDAGSPDGAGAAAGDGVARCGCDVTGTSAGAVSLFTLLFAAGVLGRRRSRS